MFEGNRKGDLMDGMGNWNFLFVFRVSLSRSESSHVSKYRWNFYCGFVVVFLVRTKDKYVLDGKLDSQFLFVVFFCVEANKKIDGMRIENRLAADAAKRQQKRQQKGEQRERDRARREEESRLEEIMEASRQQSQELLDFLRRGGRGSQERNSGEEEEEKASKIGL